MLFFFFFSVGVLWERRDDHARIALGDHMKRDNKVSEKHACKIFFVVLRSSQWPVDPNRLFEHWMHQRLMWDSYNKTENTSHTETEGKQEGEKSGGGHTTLQSNFCLTVRIKTPVFDLTVGFFFSSLSYIGLTKGSKNLIQPTPPTPYTHLFTSCMYVHIGAYEPCKNMYLAW